jgi:ribonuclease P protein component
MLKKIYRLKGEDLKVFFMQKNKTLKNKNFLIIFRENNLDFPRFSIKFNTKIFKKAVKRNKLKRRIYEIIRKNWGKIVDKKFDIVIFPLKEELINEKFDLLESEVLSLLNKI